MIECIKSVDENSLVKYDSNPEDFVCNKCLPYMNVHTFAITYDVNEDAENDECALIVREDSFQMSRPLKVATDYELLKEKYDLLQITYNEIKSKIDESEKQKKNSEDIEETEKSQE